ncbi:DUF1631 family protein [Marilutibacter alkalisoli]|uniref:DUF1631 domain-containing protein n=1 Tax=Marilutibacter alkalisoli TaxID=2591633 RepID=A0A514BP45_9GAMM|nr:DUF1631 family protein [Lysobacter alkalisoli]QDH69152.1 DUF1631 domain-containing protein [Lysobacter alkalisoli]
MSARLDSNATPPSAWNLASADLPRRVRTALERLYALTAENLGRQLENTLGDFEKQLFKLAEQARNPARQADHFEALRRVRLHRGELQPRFLGALEAALASIRVPATGSAEADSDPGLDELRLVDDAEVSEDNVLDAIATRHESRSGLPLMLLGQRFGVLAGAPAFDASHLPVGPRQLCRLLAESSRVLQLEPEARLLLFESFNHHTMNGYSQLAEAMNALLARENILPGLSYVPLRARPAEQVEEHTHAPAQEHEPEAVAPPPRRRRPPQPLAPASQRPHTHWWGQAGEETGSGGDETDDNADYQALQELLSSRREALEKAHPAAGAPEQVPLPTPDLVAALAAQQDALSPAEQKPRTIADLKRALLARGRQQHGRATRLSNEDEDTFELLGLLFTEIGRELREGTTSHSLLERLQVPLLRLALLDRAFLVRHQHPARQLLNTVAEAGARWMAEDDGDPRLERQLRQAVEHVVRNYQGDEAVFETANTSLQGHLQQLARKAELSERRHVEAARGKEKLIVARRRSADTIAQAVAGLQLPRFIQRLLEQAWADVLTLTLLRHGEDSEEWAQYAGMTSILATSGTGGAPPEGLEAEIGQALAQVGYHPGEAAQIARHLARGHDDETENPTSRTELVMKLKSHVRLGDDAGTPQGTPVPPRNPREQACYEHLRTLPFGTWMEFVLNQQGDMVRRRIAWFSTVTDRMLFVNQRGQRVDEQSLDQVSRLMAQEQARIVTADRGHLIDRAWQATLSALRNFAGMPDRPQGATS